MSVTANDICDSVVLMGSQFSEPVRVVGNLTVGDRFVVVNLVEGHCQLNHAEMSPGFACDGVRL
jgi:hypothetical protein